MLLCYNNGVAAFMASYRVFVMGIWPSPTTGDSWGRFFLCMVPPHCNTATHTHLVNTSPFHDIEMAREIDGIGHRNCGMRQLSLLVALDPTAWQAIEATLLLCSRLQLLVPVLADRKWARGPADGEGECRGQSCSGH